MLKYRYVTRWLVFLSAVALIIAATSHNCHSNILIYRGMVQDGVDGVDGLDAAWSVAVSPDGTNVYATGLGDKALTVFSRNSISGKLTFLEMHQDGVDGVDGLYEARSVTVSPDGKNVYATGGVDQSVAVFSRDTTTGSLFFVEVEKDGVNGVDGLDGASFVIVSPDGNHVYVAADYSDNAVTVFSRDNDTGALTFVEVHKKIDGVDGMSNARAVTISPDGKNVYVAGYGDRAIVVFNRNATSGALNFIEVQMDGVDGVDGLMAPRSVVVSPDGKNVYATGDIDDSLVVFSRNEETGALTFMELQKDGVNGVDGLDYARYVTVSPEGSYVYVAGDDDNAIAVFSRDDVTGALTFVEMHKNGIGGVNGISGVNSLAVSLDENHLYATGGMYDTVAVFAQYNTNLNLSAEHVWTITMGSSDFDLGQSVDVDNEGNIYLTGQFGGTVDFDPGPDTDNHTASGPDNPYITRFNADGTHVWTKVIHASDGSVGHCVAVDPDGNIFLTGGFSGTADFDPGNGVVSRTASESGDQDIYIVKIYADGSYGWVKTMGSQEDNDEGRSIAFDSDGNIYVAGFFSMEVNFNDGIDDPHIAQGGGFGTFLTKINSDGSYGWTKTFPGEPGGPFKTVRVALDRNDNIYLSGFFSDPGDFDPGPGEDFRNPSGLFLTKINADESYGWTKIFEGNIGQYSALAIDSIDNVFIASSFQGTIDFNPDPVDLDYHSATSKDVSLTKFYSDGSYAWTKILSGPGDDGMFLSSALDQNDNLYVSGTFNDSMDFDPDPIETDNITAAGSDDIFVTKFNVNESYGWTYTIGDINADWGFSNKADMFGNIYIAGAASSDIILTKLIEEGNVVSELSITVPQLSMEGDGVLSDEGVVSISRVHSADLTVALISSDTTEVTLPPTVTILQGLTSANFDLTIVDDSEDDGTQATLITAKATGWTSATEVINVEDNDLYDLNLTIPLTASEGDNTIQGTISVSSILGSDIVISLISSDTTEVTVPNSVTILSGNTSTSFDLTIIDDDIIDGGQTVTISANTPDNVSTEASIQVDDNDQQVPSEYIWTQQFPNNYPPARNECGIAYDSGNEVVVLFGGIGGGTQGDTWVWDGVNWSQVATSGPSPRYDMAMAYDSHRGVVVLFGGKLYPSTYYSDTWEWNGTAWTQVSTTGPSLRRGARMDFDSNRGVMVLYGGYNENSYFSDTWEWDGQNWSQIAVAGPSTRYHHSMVYDSIKQETILFGGRDNITDCFGDTWAYDGQNWTLLSNTGPPPRRKAAMVYDRARNVAILFGGVQPGLRFDDTWEWDGQNWTQIFVDGARKRESHSMAYDIKNKEIILYGGWDGEYLSETWIFKYQQEPTGPGWTQQFPSNYPPARNECAIAYDSGNEVVVLFGGLGGGTQSDTWLWNGINWSQVATTGPSPRYDVAIAYDSHRSVVVLFGGKLYSPLTFYNDTWEWNGSTWTQVATTGPSIRRGAQMVYDTDRSVMVLYGGSDNSDYFGDTWEWDGQNWTQISVTGPPARRHHSMIYDEIKKETIMFGGLNDTGENYGDTYSFDGQGWTLLATTGPPDRKKMAMTYDSDRNVTILFGGNQQGNRFDDTWEWDGQNWTQIMVAGPRKRESHSMVYDRNRREIVLFGGFDSEMLSDTWVFKNLIKKGDVNHDALVNLLDAMLALKVVIGMEPTDAHTDADVNEDDKIGIQEITYILQIEAELR